MQYTTLGNTGLTVSRLCLGCMTYGDPRWRTWVLDEGEAQPFIRLALDKGFNFFDTADMYSLGMSEEVTGRALRAMANLDEIVIATKVFWPMSDAPNRQGLSRKHIVQSCEGSLRRLGVETIDLYQIHRFDHAVPIEETLGALEQLVNQGKVRYLGASSGYAWELMRALSVSERNGWARFISMQPQYNLLYREEEREMIPLCHAEGLGLVPWSPIARGVLTIPQSALAYRRSACTSVSERTVEPLVFARGRVSTPRASGDHGTSPSPSAWHSGIISRSSSRYRRLYCGCIEMNRAHPFRSETLSARISSHA